MGRNELGNNNQLNSGNLKIECNGSKLQVNMVYQIKYFMK
jgi:hypothetical protein